MGEQVKIKTQL